MGNAAPPRTGFPFFDEPRAKGAVAAMAHRGAHLDGLTGGENTMPAFRAAVELGYRYLETDVQVTADGVLLAFHDDDLGRVTDRAGRVGHLSHAEVARARVAGREPIPTLGEVLEEFPHTRLNIDLKVPGAVEPMVALLEHTAAHHRVCVGSFDERTLRQFRRRLTRPVATSCGVLGAALTAFAPTDRVAAATVGWAGETGSAYQVPRLHRGVGVVGGRFVRRAHAQGRHVHVWTVDDRHEMEHLLDLGVDGLITDRPLVLREVLQQRGQWEDA